MNPNSHISNWLFRHEQFVRQSNGFNWLVKTMREKYHIRVTGDWYYTMFKYLPGADFSDPLVREARGIILSLTDFDVRAVSFDKFGNVFESYVPEIDWKSAVIQEKLDGSLVKTFYDWDSQTWRWSTNGTINATDASMNDTMSFMDGILSAANYDEIDFDKLDKYSTYTFEFVSPWNKVVIDYNTPMLYHIGTRSNITLLERFENIGVRRPRIYNIAPDLDHITDATKSFDGRIEGFVVVDKNFNRIKVKCETYLRLHHTASLKNMTARTYVEIKRNNDEEQLAAIAKNDYLNNLWNYWNQIYYNFHLLLDVYLNRWRQVYMEFGKDRKQFALWVQETTPQLSYFAFKAIDDWMLDSYTATSNLNDSQLAKYLENEQ